MNISEIVKKLREIRDAWEEAPKSSIESKFVAEAQKEWGVLGFSEGCVLELNGTTTGHRELPPEFDGCTFRIPPKSIVQIEARPSYSFTFQFLKIYADPFEKRQRRHGRACFHDGRIFS